MVDKPSIAGAVKAAVVTSNLVAGRIWRSDKVPESPTFPYVTLDDMISDTVALDGDCDVLALVMLLQIDLWQKAKDESFTLPVALRNAVSGAVLVANQKVYKCKVIDSQRLPDPDVSLVHHALTVRAVHAAALTP